MREVCTHCGTSYSDILESGFVGCEHCYVEIEKLREAIGKMYDGKIHKGRNARGGKNETI